jgi:hypothetical protein
MCILKNMATRMRVLNSNLNLFIFFPVVNLHAIRENLLATLPLRHDSVVTGAGWFSSSVFRLRGLGEVKWRLSGDGRTV